MLATSESVIATLTAQAIPPTATPRRRPVGSGAGTVTRAPTFTPDPRGITLITISKKVYAGSAGALTIRTRPNVTCNIKIARSGAEGSPRVAAIDGGTRQASDDGVIAWIWAVEADEPTGPASVLVTCPGVGTAEYAIEIAR